MYRTTRVRPGGAAALIAAALLVVAGCASPPRESNTPRPDPAPAAPGTPRTAPAAPEGYATVYFYRVGGMLYMRRPDVLIRNVVVAEPTDKSFTYVYVRAGAAPLIVKWTWDVGWLPVGFTRSFEAGRTYYFRITAGSMQSQHTTLEDVTAENAEREMAGCCKYLKPNLQKVD